MRFEDRKEAGKLLAQNIVVSDPANTVILALPRGGVPLGIITANYHSAEFNVILAKKIGHPSNTEFAIGAMAEGGEPIMNQMISVDNDWLNERVEQINQELGRRRALYSEILVEPAIEGKDVIIVDDGIATGMTMFAAIEAVKAGNPRSISAAVPIIPLDTYQQLERMVDTVYYVEVAKHFMGSVGAYYRSFSQVSDNEVEQMMRANKV